MARLERALFAPVDLASQAAFRAGFGALMVWHLLEYLLGGRLERHYIEPIFYFAFPGFAWVEPLPGPWLRALFWLLVLAAAGIAAGLFYRASALVFAAGYSYVFLLDAAAYNNHTYLICLLAWILLALPAHRLFSLDAGRRPRRRADAGPAWTLGLLRFQIAIPYFFGGIAKLNYDWLVRAEPIGLWLREGTGGAFEWGLLRAPWMAYALAWGGALLDLVAVPLLLWRRSRLPAFLILVAFHLANAGLFVIGIFPWLMIWATLVFFPPAWPRRAGRLRRREVTRGALVTPPRRRPLLIAVLAVYGALQVLLPLRHLMYPGGVDWTEEGHRFAWRMKLRDKRGTVEFVALDAARRTLFRLADARALLTGMQWRMMLHDPDMLRQFAAFLGRTLREEGRGELEVRVLTSISLNGREPKALVDPEADLSAVRPGRGGREWIVREPGPAQKLMYSSSGATRAGEPERQRSGGSRRSPR